MDRVQDIRELKLGASFTNPNARTAFHSLKYDFKPASVDVHKEATLETGSNNTITVTLPHLDGSGVPNTVFKGNHREYSKKECILIINRETNEITLERLQSNVQVKKTRADSQSNKSQQQQQQQMQSGVAQQSTSSSSMNSAGGGGGSGSSAGMGKNDSNVTVRHCTKTRVSTGARKNNNILNFVPKNSPNTLQGSPSYSHSHRSPQQAPLWNANNTQQTLPSIPSLLDDNNFTSNQAPSSAPISSSSVYNKSSNVSNNSMAAVSMPKASSVSLMAQQQQQQQSQSVMDDIGELSSSSASSDSNDSDDSDSDSGDSSANNHSPVKLTSVNTIMPSNSISNHNKVATMSNHLDNSTALLRKDLCLSDSNSDSEGY